MADRDVVICAPVRTAIGTFGGTLKDMPATELGAVALRAAMECAGPDSTKVDGVVMGNVIQAGNRRNPVRQAAIGAGIPVSAPALTVNRVCGSGAQAIASAAQEIRLGEAKVMIAGGMENIDRASYLLSSGRWGMCTRLLHGMARAGQTRGQVTPRIGGGQGIALCLERPH